ncbi:MAG: Holliday junction branch migration protein RuvA [Bacteroidales bacterium]|nr:Holliday junction branch migration protein RuvA [Bacteroidales bacterium]
MFAYIEGILVEKNPAFVILDCNGTGYMLHISLNTFSKLQQLQQKCRLFTHLQIKEDAHTLYGFFSQEERSMFRLLIAVSGVGASTAQVMLSAMNVQELASCIAAGDAKTLQTIKGIGAKTAQRIIIDLRDKTGKIDVAIDRIDMPDNNIRKEALIALASLGFSKQSAEKAVDKIITASDGTVSVETLIKEALKIL